jgi:tRNA(Ile)-lysidine synthase
VDSTTPGIDRPANASRLRAALGAVSRDPAAREIARRWRTLTGGDGTLLACSGGADSAALVLALAAAEPSRFVVGHVVHDLRPAEAVYADRDFVRDLADSLGLPFDERAVAVPPRGNAEAGARRLRYAALADMARAHGSGGAGFVATAHHAEDQLETMLLALLRGAGPKGLSGMRPKRRLADDVALIRPMLGVSRADAERLCALAGVEWRTDETNADLSRARAAIRHRVLPALEDIRPGAAGRAAHTAELLHGAALLVADRVEAVFGDPNEWPRESLRAERAIVVGEGLRRAFERASGGAKKDRLPRRVVEQAVVFIRSNSGETKSFQWPGGVRVEVDARTVRVTSPC